MVPLGSGARRSVNDYMLTRYACYLLTTALCKIYLTAIAS